MLLSRYFGLPISPGAVTEPIVIPGTDLSDYLGLLTLMIMALIGLIMTGRFAVNIASGVGGFGGVVSSVAYGSVRTIQGFQRG